MSNLLSTLPADQVIGAASGTIKVQNLAAPVGASDAARNQDIPTALPPNGSAGGDLTGTYPNPTVAAGAITEAKQNLADNTTNNVSTSKHGYVPKAPNDATKYLDGTGAYSVPTGGAPSTVILARDTNANRPAANTAGRTFNPTDWNQQYQDNGATWDGCVPGFAPLCKRWAQFGTAHNGSQSGYSDTVVNGGEAMKVGNTASVLLSGQMKAIPSQTNVGLQMFAEILTPRVKNYFGGGVFITDGTKFIGTHFIFDTNGPFVVGSNWSNDSTLSAYVNAEKEWPLVNRFWVRIFIDNSGGNQLVHYAMSLDGINWTEIGNAACYNNLLGATSTQYGYMIFGGNNSPVVLNIHSLQEVTL
jgi:hypothetical protein